MLQAPRVRKALENTSVSHGRGSEGISAGGLGAETDLTRFTTGDFLFGEVSIGQAPATTRGAPPTLIGLGILATHSVTLDYPGSRIVLHPRTNPDFAKTYPGYSLMRIGKAAGAPAIASSKDRWHPVNALWSSDQVSQLEAYLGNGSRSVHGWAEACSAKTVQFAAEPDARDPFWNVNTREDLVIAAKLLDQSS